MKDKTLLVLREGKANWSTGWACGHRPLASRGRLGSRKLVCFVAYALCCRDTVVCVCSLLCPLSTFLCCKAIGL